ncbi:hypothetical protein HHO41_08165 [Bacillus sp. DNRA2]|uniref:hypothetical protein n=1 Tax=Bacillus sp. DNRA2 TaxID=2723053 RepID=UPI00145F65A7|nr:hypothetical protein [Bacillus sp. DNRA2]NMD70265.1 hypothetical protein [Bacillus sp. DNRA2]
MLVKQCKGYELEKEKPNTSEDFFNRSEVVYVDNGEEKILHVLYVRYFDEVISEFTPYTDKTLFHIDTKEVTFKDIVALVCLIKNPALSDRKRIYINRRDDFASYFAEIEFSKLPEIFREIDKNQGYELRNPSEFIVQPQ